MDDSDAAEMELARAEFESLGEKTVRDKITRSRHTTSQWNRLKIEIAERWLQDKEDARLQVEKDYLKLERHRDRRAGIISTGAACLSAVVSLVTLYFLNATLMEDRAAKRPYFAIQAQIPGNDIYVHFSNIGVHPAKDVSTKIVFVDKNFEGDPEVHTRDFGNELPAGVAEDLSLPQHWGTEQYMVVQLTYFDPVLEKRLFQDPVVFVEKGSIDAQVSREEKQKVLSHPSVRKLLLLR